MTGPKRRLSESEAEEEAIAADVEAREAGARSFRHWRDRNEPPATVSALAMRQACPYRRSDARVEGFMQGWHDAEGTAAFDHEYRARGRCEVCRVEHRPNSRFVEVVLRSGERVRTLATCVRKVSA